MHHRDGRAAPTVSRVTSAIVLAIKIVFAAAYLGASLSGSCTMVHPLSPDSCIHMGARPVARDEVERRADAHRQHAAQVGREPVHPQVLFGVPRPTQTMCGETAEMAATT